MRNTAMPSVWGALTVAFNVKCTQVRVLRADWKRTYTGCHTCVAVVDWKPRFHEPLS